MLFSVQVIKSANERSIFTGMGHGGLITVGMVDLRGFDAVTSFYAGFDATMLGNGQCGVRAPS
jgi:hypothetical protein